MSGSIEKTIFIVETEDVKKYYRLGKNVVRALDGVDIRVPAGELRCLMGPSGSGKSTLLNLIGGLDKATAGRVIVQGREVSRMDQLHLSILRKLSVGFVFQIYNLLPTLTAAENVMLSMEFLNVPGPERNQRARELLEEVGMSHRLDHRPGQLSGGEQQRVSIARALANLPSVLLADEPTGNLDTKTGLEVIAVVKELTRKVGVTAIVSTHDPRIADTADSITYLRDGKVVSETAKMEGLGTCEEILLSPALKLSPEVAKIMADPLKKAMQAAEVSAGSIIHRMGADWEVVDTKPRGKVRVVHQTVVTIRA